MSPALGRGLGDEAEAFGVENGGLGLRRVGAGTSGTLLRASFTNVGCGCLPCSWRRTGDRQQATRWTRTGVSVAQWTRGPYLGWWGRTGAAAGIQRSVWLPKPAGRGVSLEPCSYLQLPPPAFVLGCRGPQPPPWAQTGRSLFDTGWVKPPAWVQGSRGPGLEVPWEPLRPPAKAAVFLGDRALRAGGLPSVGVHCLLAR